MQGAVLVLRMGVIFALTLDEQGNEVSKRWVINGNVFDGDKTHQMK